MIDIFPWIAESTMKYKYDLFISYARLDRLIVKRLWRALVKRGFDVWLDEHEIAVGDVLVSKIDEGIRLSRYLALWMTNNSVKSNWVKFEWETGLHGEVVDGDNKRILPLLGEQCDIPGVLKRKKYIDFSVSFKKGLAELIHFLEDRTSVTIKECVQGLISGVDAKLCAEKLSTLAIRENDETALQALWDSARKTTKPVNVVDHCSWYVGEVIIMSRDSAMQLSGLGIIEESAASGVDILVDKFAYAAGDVALQVEDLSIRRRVARFIEQCSVSDKPSLRKWYAITKDRIKEHDELFFEKFLDE